MNSVRMARFGLFAPPLAFAAGCVEEDQRVTPPEEERQAAIAEEAKYPAHWWRRYRRHLERLEEIPGYTGAFVEGEEGQRMVVLLEDPATQASTARAALMTPGLAGQARPPVSVRVQDVTYGLIDLIRWREIILQNVRQLRGVLRMDRVDFTHNRISFGVLPGTDRSALEKEIEALGIPLDAVHIEFFGGLEIEAKADPDPRESAGDEAS